MIEGGILFGVRWAARAPESKRRWGADAEDEQSALRRIAIAVGEMARYGRLWFACAAVLAIKGGSAGERLAYQGMRAIVVSWLASHIILKPLVKRQRPADEDDSDGRADEDSSSFPSSHTASGAAFATALALEDRRAGAAAALLACVVAYSRVTTGAHHLGDVVGGAALGTGIAAALRRRGTLRRSEGVADGGNVRAAP